MAPHWAGASKLASHGINITVIVRDDAPKIPEDLHAPQRLAIRHERVFNGGRTARPHDVPSAPVCPHATGGGRLVAVQAGITRLYPTHLAAGEAVAVRDHANPAV